MAYTKMEIQTSDLQVGDVFRIVKSTGNLQTVFEYEVVKPIEVIRNPHPKFPEMLLTDIVIKVKNRKNGQAKTLKYTDGKQTVWRKA